MGSVRVGSGDVAHLSPSPSFGSAVAWAAGLFEGEGCFYLSQRSGRPAPDASLGMADEDVVRRFHSVVGVGNVNVRDQARYSGNPKVKPQYQWRTASFEGVQAVVAMFWPFLGARRRAKARDVLRQSRELTPYHSHKTECPSGHPYDDVNTLVMQGRRHCRACRNAASRARYQRKREEIWRRTR